MGLAQTETGAKPSKDARAESRRATQRENEILQELRRSGGSSRIQNLADRLKVSEETIRRNLKSLARDGLVRRVHGGAHLPDARSEASFQQRVDENPDAKRRIAEKVAEIIEDGDSLFLDIGSTTSYIAQALQHRRDLFVVTNSVSVAHTLAARNGNRVFMAGGELRAHDGGAFGVEAIEFVRRFQVEYAVLSAAAINAASGFMLFDLQEAEFSREIMRRAKTSIVAADSSKFDHRAPISVDAPSLVDVLVTDSAPPADLGAALSSWSVDVVLADEESDER
ncbi:DeoR/GlpR family DNA-binding transcription regulator [Denitrobaculum tricleocarpae]|uniref:DeoR/GlpR transcriptional regulator n=1 Tax=Denitrobaculum tricleocarpae TaxID=2591009 RepID=A0A545STQ4_9PROT|nr:DeoR/GlpR family DNA-binding transcription regulator [Denitrobaculum tricleocarpae]TQV68333.1 DeoR/GlpR transcriptional regulator [Denitrobaculum tricleocarpae]